MTITDRLFKLQDVSYGDFQSRLVPGINRESFIGVRVPLVRKLARELYKNEDIGEFLKNLPHKYYDEDMLHGLILAEIKDYETCIKELDVFLPYVNNWAVCDVISPKIFKKHKAELIIKIKEWINAKDIYVIRFGIEMLMTHFLDEDFDRAYLELTANIKSEEYYVNMMRAWFFATALAKQWETAISYIENNKLDVWIHNKTIQKAKESLRIIEEQKVYLNALKK